jgi:hypothetical protein
LAIESMQSCLSFKIIFAFSVLVKARHIIATAADAHVKARRERSGRVIDSVLFERERASNPTESHSGRIEPPAAGCDLTAH